MEKKEMLKLATFEKYNIWVEGEDLAEVANMYYMAIGSYLELCKLYLSILDEKLPYGYELTRSYSQIKDKGCCCRFTKQGEILVPEEGYEDLKRRLFDLAYINCADIRDKAPYYENHGLEVYDDDFRETIISDGPNYSSIYLRDNGVWDYVETFTPVDKEDKEKRYSLISR